MDQKSTNDWMIKNINEAKIEFKGQLKKMQIAMEKINPDILVKESTETKNIPGIRQFLRDVSSVNHIVNDVQRTINTIAGAAIYTLPIK